VNKSRLGSTEGGLGNALTVLLPIKQRKDRHTSRHVKRDTCSTAAPVGSVRQPSTSLLILSATAGHRTTLRHAGMLGNSVVLGGTAHCLRRSGSVF